MRARWRSLFLLLTIGPIATAGGAHAEDFYKGKIFNIVVGFSPAGGFDTYARAVARYLGAHIPGEPTAIVQNMPGAGSLTSVRYLEMTAPKDGTVMTIFNPGLVTQSIVEPEKVRLDFRKFAWIGIVTPDYRVCYGFGAKGIKSWDDMMERKQFIIGATGKGTGNYIDGAILREVFHAPVRQVQGFPGSAEMRLAIERGELDGDCGSLSSIPPEWIAGGEAHPFLRFSHDWPAEFPATAAYIGEFADTDEQRQLLHLFSGGDALGRGFVMSRAVPPAQIAILRKAFNDTMKDPAFVSEMAKQQLPFHPSSGEEADAIIADLAGVAPPIVARAKAVYQ